MNDSAKLVEALRSALRENERLRKLTDDMAQADGEPIAIVGMGCRFRGGVSSAAGLWDLVAGEADAITAPPADRGWRSARRPGRPPSWTARPGSTPGSSASRRARRSRWTRSSGCCWRARGRRWSGPGIDPLSLEGIRHRRLRRLQPARLRAARDAASTDLEGLLATGNAAAVLSGRVSYALGLEGPAVDRRHGVLVVAGRAAPGGAARCAAASARWRWPAARRSWPPPACSSSSAGRAGSPPTAAARRSPPTPTAPAGARASACCVVERLSDAERARPPGARRGPRHRGQPGRRLQRPDRAERPRAAAGHPAGAGRRRADRRRRRRRRGARHRHDARRPDRGAGAAGDVRPGPRRTARCGSARSSPTSATPRPPPASPASSRWSRRCGTACCRRPCTSTSPPRTSTGPPATVRLLTEARPWPGRGPPAPRRRLLVRRQRHQRARHPRTGPGAEAPGSPSATETGRRACRGCSPAARPGRPRPAGAAARRPAAERPSPRPTSAGRSPPPAPRSSDRAVVVGADPALDAAATSTTP